MWWGRGDLNTRPIGFFVVCHCFHNALWSQPLYRTEPRPPLPTLTLFLAVIYVSFLTFLRFSTFSFYFFSAFYCEYYSFSSSFTKYSYCFIPSDQNSGFVISNPTISAIFFGDVLPPTSNIALNFGMNASPSF